MHIMIIGKDKAVARSGKKTTFNAPTLQKAKQTSFLFSTCVRPKEKFTNQLVQLRIQVHWSNLPLRIIQYDTLP